MRGKKINLGKMVSIYEKLYLVELADGRRAELRARSKKRAAEQAAAVWGIPTEYLLERARITAL